MYPSGKPALAALVLLGVTGLLTLSGLISGCGTDGPTVITTGPSPTHAELRAAPTGLTWQRFQGIPIPRTQQGPTIEEGPVAAGYEHSPRGSAVAAIQATVRISIADDIQWSRVVDRMVQPGVGRDQWATARIQLSITEPVTSDRAPQILGYSLLAYTPDSADVAIFTRQPDNSLTRNTATVAWHDTDWLLVLPEDPDSTRVTAVPATPADMVWLPL
ncbi:hypothetical protein ACQPXH_00285 [Nocardia sp. CA-135953]|uniref:hypothetical protein n=1 Tax=Nocardia sp. CA-135953 TaxID=3239978 RepID=UPI003D99ED3E